MAVREPRLTKEEHARLGAETYEKRVRPQVEAGNHGKIVGIDVETGEFEVADQTRVHRRVLNRRLDNVWRQRYRRAHAQHNDATHADPPL